MKPAMRLTNPHSATSHCEPVADERALPPLPHIPTSYLQLKNLDKIHGMMRDYARAALAGAPVAKLPDVEPEPRSASDYPLPLGGHSAPVAGEAVTRGEYDRGFSNGWDRGYEHGRDIGFSGGICVALQVLTTHDQATIWRDIVTACDVKKMLDYAANVEPDEWELAGFKQYARAELDKRKPRKRSVPAAPQASEAARILFPAHLRKMWSGGEVQAWLDEHQGVTPPPATVKGSLERYRQWKAGQAAPVCSCPSGDGSLRPCAVHSAQPTNDGGSNR